MANMWYTHLPITLDLMSDLRDSLERMGRCYPNEYDPN